MRSADYSPAKTWRVFQWHPDYRPPGAIEIGEVEAEGQPHAILEAGRTWPDVPTGSIIVRIKGEEVAPPLLTLRDGVPIQDHGGAR